MIIYKDVKIIRIKDRKYQLTIMKDYIPIIGEIDGTVQIELSNKTICFENIKAYYMNKQNQFKLFVKEEE